MGVLAEAPINHHSPEGALPRRPDYLTADLSPRMPTIHPDPLDACFTALGIVKDKFLEDPAKKGDVVGRAYMEIFRKSQGKFEDRAAAYLARQIILARYGGHPSFDSVPSNFPSTEVSDDGLRLPEELTPAQQRLQIRIEGACARGLSHKELMFWHIVDRIKGESAEQSGLPIMQLKRMSKEAQERASLQGLLPVFDQVKSL